MAAGDPVVYTVSTTGEGRIAEGRYGNYISLTAEPAAGWRFDRWDYTYTYTLYDGADPVTASDTNRGNPFLFAATMVFWREEYVVGAVFVQRAPTGQLLCTGSDSSVGAGKMLCDSSGNLLYDG